LNGKTVCCIITINLLLVFWFHPIGDILYHRNLLTKRGFFIFLNSYVFFRVGLLIRLGNKMAGDEVIFSFVHGQGCIQRFLGFFRNLKKKLDK